MGPRVPLSPCTFAQKPEKMKQLKYKKNIGERAFYSIKQFSSSILARPQLKQTWPKQSACRVDHKIKEILM